MKIPTFAAYDARRRLDAVQKDIEKYGEGCPQMFFMQRDLITKEVEYYEEQSAKFVRYLLLSIIISVILVNILF